MPSSSLFLRSSTALISLLSLISVPVSAGSDTYYAIDTKYEGAHFFDGFNFFADADPTHGYVTYGDKSYAQTNGLIASGNGQNAFMKVDSQNKLTVPASVDNYYNTNNVGRKSVRIESAKSWTHALILADIKHMPTTKSVASAGCGTWPAFWTLGSGEWPYNGEMDVLEGCNDQGVVASSGHTGNTCIIEGSSANMTGILNLDNCNLSGLNPYGSGPNTAGCKVSDTRAASYGPDYNAGDGGVYAMEWTDKYIKNYFFPRTSIPADVAAGSPDPSTWGKPFATFNGPSCNINTNFKDHRIIFDTTFCGDFGDATWDSGCSAKTGVSTCAAFVAQNPTEFSEAYWEIPYVHVYTQKPMVTSSSSATLTTSSSTSTTTTNNVYTTSSTYPTLGASTTASSSYDLPFPHPSSTTETLNSYPTTSSSFEDSPFPHPSTTTGSVTASVTEHPTSFDHATLPSLSSSVTTTAPSSKLYGPMTIETSSLTTIAAAEGDETGSSWVDWPLSSSSATTSSATVDPKNSASMSWADWESTSSTSSKASDPTFAASISWEDWESTSVTTSAKPSDPTMTASFSWEDWESTTTTSPKPSDPTANESWADWDSSSSPSTSSKSKPVDPTWPATGSASVSWADWVSTSSPADPISTTDWNWGAASWTTPSTVSIASLTTMTVQPVASSDWAAQAHDSGGVSSSTGVSPVGASGSGNVGGSGSWGAGASSTATDPWLATYTGAAGRVSSNRIAAVVGIILGGIALL